MGGGLDKEEHTRKNRSLSRKGLPKRNSRWGEGESLSQDDFFPFSQTDLHFPHLKKKTRDRVKMAHNVTERFGKEGRNVSAVLRENYYYPGNGGGRGGGKRAIER